MTNLENLAAEVSEIMIEYGNSSCADHIAAATAALNLINDPDLEVSEEQAILAAVADFDIEL